MDVPLSRRIIRVQLQLRKTQFHMEGRSTLRHHFIREAIRKGIVGVEYCPSEKMIADLLTKTLARDRFIKLCMVMGMTLMAAHDIN